MENPPLHGGLGASSGRMRLAKNEYEGVLIGHIVFVHAGQLLQYCIMCKHVKMTPWPQVGIWFNETAGTVGTVKRDRRCAA